MKLLISPYSRKRPDGKQSSKDYPWWKELVAILKEKGVSVIQIGIRGEAPIGADEIHQNLPLEEIKNLLKSCDGWVSVDNFLQHLAFLMGIKGVCIFGPSDPLIFGHPENINILKDRKYLRQLQFTVWHTENMVEDRFDKPEIVADIILKYLKKE